jgi:hypothetical protein
MPQPHAPLRHAHVGQDRGQSTLLPQGWPHRSDGSTPRPVPVTASALTKADRAAPADRLGSRIAGVLQKT